MCVVSVIGDHYHQKWNQPDYRDLIQRAQQNQTSTTLGAFIQISRVEFDALKKEVEEMKVLLAKAIEYDKKNNEPECQVEEKLATLKKVAELLGVDLSDIIK